MYGPQLNQAVNYQTLYTTINDKQASYHQLNDTGVDAHFYPANGFTVGCYNSFLKPLSAQYTLHSLASLYF